MCGANKRFFLYLFLALLFVCAAGVLHGEEREVRYLITEAELPGIEAYKAKSGAEKQTRLLQAQKLKAPADSLRRDSETLNSQLAQARETDRRLAVSFSGLEAGRLTRLSLKHGENEALKQAAENCRRTARSRLAAIIVPAGAWAVFAGYKLCRFFRVL